MAYWTTSRRRYVDPLQYTIECGSEPSRDKAVAALVAASRSLNVGLPLTVAALFIPGFFVLFGFMIFADLAVGGGQAPVFFTLVPLIFILIGMSFILVVIRSIKRNKEASHALQELARMVQSGFLDPRDICGLTVAAAIELYRMKSGSLASGPSGNALGTF